MCMQLPGQKKPKLCVRCRSAKPESKVTIATVPLKLCAPCTEAVQSDPADAVQTVQQAVGIVLELKKTEPMCEMCTERAAFTRTVMEGKSLIVCASCMTKHPDFARMVLYALSCVHQGDLAEARQSFMELLKMSPNHAATLYNLACVESLANDVDAAFALLGQALDNGYRRFKNIMKDSDLAPVRQHAGFKAMIADHQARIAADEQREREEVRRSSARAAATLTTLPTTARHCHQAPEKRLQGREGEGGRQGKRTLVVVDAASSNNTHTRDKHRRSLFEQFWKQCV